MAFTAKEQAYLASRRIGSIATVSPEGEVDVAPVGFRFDGERFLVGGRGLERTLKYRNVRAGSGRVAFAVEDRTRSGQPRGLKVHGRGEIASLPDGREVIAITPDRSWSWGVEEPAFREDGAYVLRRSLRGEGPSPQEQGTIG